MISVGDNIDTDTQKLFHRGRRGCKDIAQRRRLGVHRRDIQIQYAWIEEARQWPWKVMFCFSEYVNKVLWIWAQLQEGRSPAV